MPPSAANAMDHVILVLFENRSFDNMLGRLYGPEDGKTFEGVIGKDLSNPVPDWAEHPAPGGRVPYTTTTDMDAPNPDSGEEYFHTNTQLYNTIDQHNIGKMGAGVTAPWNVPPAGAKPTMDGFVTDYINCFWAEMGRQPTYEEYSKIMTGYTPEQVPVLSGLARDFGVFDHWFCEVPSQTFMNRSFWTAATSSGFVVNSPFTNFTQHNTAETIFERLEAHGRTWKVYVYDGSPVSFTALIHMQRLKDKFATNFVPFSEFEADAAAGNLPDFSFIEPNLTLGHGDYHPAMGRAMIQGDALEIDPPSSILAGEVFLKQLYDAYRGMPDDGKANVYNTTLMIGWDEPGGTYDHVPPGAVPPPDPAAPAGQCDFRFDRSGYRTPAIVVSPWVEQGSVYNEEHRHTSLIATMRKLWDLGEPLTQRDAAARPIDYVFSRDTPRAPAEWAEPVAEPVPAAQMSWMNDDTHLSGLGKAMMPALVHAAQQAGYDVPKQLLDPNFPVTSNMLWQALELLSWHFFPLLSPKPDDVEAVRESLMHEIEAGGAQPVGASAQLAYGKG